MKGQCRRLLGAIAIVLSAILVSSCSSFLSSMASTTASDVVNGNGKQYTAKGIQQQNVKKNLEKY